MSEEVVAYEAPHRDVLALPIMSVEQAITRFQQIQEFVSKLMVDGTDFGTIPGTEKPTLYKAGAEKLDLFFGLVPTFATMAESEDWTGHDHGGEPFFFYRVKCALWRGDNKRAEGEGSCNSWEAKYRYRLADRACPSCGVPAISKSKEEWGGGWYCSTKRKGCGAKFAKDDKRITEQPAGRIPNPDVADLANTILKMAQKRAFVGATLIGTGASMYYTQDLEDIGPALHGNEHVIEGEVLPLKPPTDQAPPRSNANGHDVPLSDGQRKAIWAIAKNERKLDDDQIERCSLSWHGVHVGQLSKRQASEFIETLKSNRVFDVPPPEGQDRLPEPSEEAGNGPLMATLDQVETIKQLLTTDHAARLWLRRKKDFGVRTPEQLTSRQAEDFLGQLAKDL